MTNHTTTTPPFPTRQTPIRPGCSRQLDREWQRLRTSRPALSTVRRWGAVAPDAPLAAVIADLADLDDIVVATQRGRAHADEILVALIELSSREPLAGRIVLQRLLPPLVQQARCYLRSDRDAIESAVASAWIAISSYDTERRPRHVAPALVSDAIDRAFRGPARRRSAQELPATDVLFDRRSADAPVDAFGELAEVVAEARRRGVDRDHLAVIRELVTAGSTEVLAARHGVTSRTIRNRRIRAVDAIRHAVAPAA